MHLLRSTSFYRLIAGLLLAATAPLLAPPGLMAGQAVDRAPADWLRAHYAGPRAEAFEAALAEVEAQQHPSFDAFLYAFLNAYAAQEGVPAAHLAGFHTLSGPLTAFAFQAHLLAMVTQVVSGRMGAQATAWSLGYGAPVFQRLRVPSVFPVLLPLLNRRADGAVAGRLLRISAAQPLGP